jgi:ABC-type multidrug transport system fused ATPase/permease subunit
MLDDIAINAVKQTQRIEGSRVVASKENNERIHQLNKVKIENQKLILAESKKGENQDVNLVKDLECQNKEIDEQIESLTAVNDKHRQDKEIENNWDERIKKTFTNLKTVTTPLEKQKYNSFVEWILWIVIIIFSTILLFTWYIWLVTNIPNLGLNMDASYLKLMPYLLPIPVYIAILWIGIIQKGKARKVQLAIATLLFNIHYLESLLQMINKLSKNADVAVDNINNLLKKIIEQYIQQIGKNDIDVKLMDNIEKEEDKDNPLIDKLTDIIKNLTSHG